MDPAGTPPDEAPRQTRARLVVAALVVVALGLLVFARLERGGPGGSETETAQANGRDEWNRMFRSEELIHTLTPRLEQLAFAVENLELPDAESRALLSPGGVRVIDQEIDRDAGSSRQLASIGTRVWPIRPLPTDAVVPPDEIHLWRELLDPVAYFLHATFSVAAGRFVGEGEYETELVFQGLAVLESGTLAALETRQTLRWRKASPGPDAGADWRIVEWRSLGGRRMDTTRPLFEDVLDRALQSPAVLASARQSIHERIAAEFLLEKREKPHRYFFLPALDRHPGLAVVDLDRDGLDDIYVMARWGKNRLYRNRGDGTFEEIAERMGLDIEAHSSSAVFADFDNDGDADLFLGRTLERSAYFENRDGRFVDRSAEAVDTELPYLASSISAVDYNRDGLLDVYVTTYGARTIVPVLRRVARAHRAGRFDPERPAPGFGLLPDRDMLRIIELQASPEAHAVLNSAGPPNLLLRNVGGGHFKRVLKGTPLELYRNTYQATWADFDDDGDPDVYLANDFAPDSLVRNDGRGKFTDVTDSMRGAELGLAMGATWGDYDRDGRQDLYVTNMYSKAGRRVTSSLSGLDPRFAEAASGNTLFRNLGDAFERVSGDGPDDMQVSHAGWGWGSLFADVDNDGFVDLFALSGYYSAPVSTRAAVDT